MKVALVVDWLTEGFGGGERVIKAVHDMYPEAPIYTSQYRPERTAWLGAADVRTGWLNRFPVSLRRFIPFLRQLYFSHLNLSEYNLVISITGAEAKAVKTGEKTLHVSYMHAPTQYYWTLYDDYMNNPGFGVLNPLARFALKVLIGPLRRSDYAAAQRPDVIVTISSYMQAEIQKYYQRESTIIWPNVDTAGIQQLVSPGTEQRTGYVMFGRQVVWKRFDLAVKAVQKTGDTLTIIGDGPEHERLKKLAAGSANIVFAPRYEKFDEIIDVVRSSKAFVFPSLEPFGIAPVEALAVGTPVIALRKGGSLDFVRDGENGVFFEEQTVDSLADALRRCSEMNFDEQLVMSSAEKFSTAVFNERLQRLIEERLCS